MQDITKEYGYPWYPRHVVDLEGRSIVVNNQHEHGRRIGKKVLYNATIVQAPTLEVVIAAGYSPEDAQKIVSQEKEKEAKGYKPYGDIEPPEPVRILPDPPNEFPVVDLDGNSLGMGKFVNTEEASTIVPVTEPVKSNLDDEPGDEPSEEPTVDPALPVGKGKSKKAAPKPDNWE